MARTSNTDRYAKKGGWSFFQPICAKCVIVAEKKLPWYDEERYADIARELRKSRCKCVYNTSDENELKKIRTTSVIEVYRKFDGDVPFEEKVEAMLRIMDSVDFE